MLSFIFKSSISGVPLCLLRDCLSVHGSLLIWEHISAELSHPYLINITNVPLLRCDAQDELCAASGKPRGAFWSFCILHFFPKWLSEQTGRTTVYEIVSFFFFFFQIIKQISRHPIISRFQDSSASLKSSLSPVSKAANSRVRCAMKGRTLLDFSPEVLSLSHRISLNHRMCDHFKTWFQH